MKKTHPHDKNDRQSLDHVGDNHYNDELNLSPIERLMSDELDEIDVMEEPNAFVSGFDRSQPEEHPAPVERRRPKRERPAPADPDDDFFEVGIREARAGRERDRERRRAPNPNPRPAVRATVPTPKRMATPPPRHEEEGIYMSDSPPEDQYDTFRQRYNPRDLISAGRGGRPVRKGAPPPRDDGPGPSRGSIMSRFADDDDSENPNMLRMIYIAGVFVLLAIIVIMIVSRTRLSTRYNDAQETIASMQAAYARTNSLEREVNELNAEITVKDNRITYLESQINQQQVTGLPNDTTPVDGDDPDDGAVSAPGQGNFPVQHTVASGQNLTAIARLHYGPGTATENHLRMLHIAEYNNVPYPFTLRVGDVITIPPLP